MQQKLLVTEARTEDDIAMLRKESEYVNVLLVEQPNTNFAYTNWASIFI